MSIEVTTIPKEVSWRDITINQNKNFNWHDIINADITSSNLNNCTLKSDLDATGFRVRGMSSPLQKGDALSMGNPNPAIAGNLLYAASDERRETTSSTWTRLKQIQIWREGEYRINFDMRGTTLGATHLARVFRNGTGRGQIFQNTTSTWQEYTQVLGNWNAGDLVQVFAKVFGNSTVQVERFRLYTADGGAVVITL